MVQTSPSTQDFRYPFASTYVKPLIRSQVINDEPWFVATDICNILQLNDTRRAVERLDEDEKLNGVILHSGQKRKMWLINESGLYNLIFRSDKPEAKQFRKWVTATVLPALRKHGSYSTAHSARHCEESSTKQSPELAALFNRRVKRITVNGKSWYRLSGVLEFIKLHKSTGSLSRFFYGHRRRYILCINNVRYISEKGLAAFLSTRNKHFAHQLYDALFSHHQIAKSLNHKINAQLQLL